MVSSPEKMGTEDIRAGNRVYMKGRLENLAET